MLFGPWVSRPGGGKQQVFLQTALDDASRLIPHAQFYPNQGLDAFLDCLRQAIAARGIPTRLYMDNAFCLHTRVSYPTRSKQCRSLPLNPRNRPGNTLRTQTGNSAASYTILPTRLPVRYPTSPLDR